MPPNSRPRTPSLETIPVRPPFRLDLTANALRRLATNAVDVFVPDGRLLRATGDGSVQEITQHAPDAIVVRTWGTSDASAQRLLGVDADLRPFRRRARAFPWLDAIAKRMAGLHPPRYPSLWEAVVNAIVFQQVSIHAAAAILGRVLRELATPIEHDGVVLIPFPSPERYVRASDERLRELGLSINKVRALRENAERLAAGDLTEADLAPLTTAEAIERLTQLRGIGPWTAAVICLRGLGRLDVFPLNDSGAERSLRELSGGAVDVDALLSALGDQRGMLYYHLLLGRLLARGTLLETTAPV